jgi:hypothetical protein
VIDKALMRAGFSRLTYASEKPKRINGPVRTQAEKGEKFCTGFRDPQPVEMAYAAPVASGHSAKEGIQNSKRDGASLTVIAGTASSIDFPKCLNRIALMKGIRKNGMVFATCLTSVMTSPSAASGDVLLLARFKIPNVIIRSDDK